MKAILQMARVNHQFEAADQLDVLHNNYAEKNNPTDNNNKNKNNNNNKNNETNDGKARNPKQG